MAGDTSKMRSFMSGSVHGEPDGSHAGPSRTPAVGSQHDPDALYGGPHYPLSGGPLPFSRYDHRRITARDIMVHRIMADLMNPKRVEPRTYDQTITYPADFTPIKAQDRELGRDLQVLRKMLFTSHANDPSMPSSFRQGANAAAVQRTISRKKREALEKRSQNGEAVTLEEQILDLVTRHYLETDDSTLRVWMARARPPQIPSGPRAPLPNRGRNTAKGLTRAEAVKEFTRLIENQRGRDGKQWKEEDTIHLRSLRWQVATQDRLILYDGGLFARLLQHRIDYDMARPKGTRHDLEKNHWAITTTRSAWLSLPRWPEKSATQRLILQPSRMDLEQTKHPLKARETFTLLDFSLNPGRGRNRDSWWTTGQGPEKLRGHHKGLTQADGRYGRERRRCCSEPPPGSFMVANFPLPDKAVGSILLEIVVPRMKLSTLDQRSRRRSLSRTRIEEMFDWDMTLPRGSRWNGYPGKPGITADKIAPVESSADPLKKTSHRRCRCKTKIPQPSRTVAKGKSICTEKSPKKTGSKFTCRCRNLKPCENCGRVSHLTQDCRSPCGHCGAPNPRASTTLPPGLPPQAQFPTPDYDTTSPGVHQSPHIAPQCPVARQNRCKCVPFPTFHVAASCPVPCSRACGYPEPAGTFRHRNAMTCKLRCCMCGLRGHSGRECRLQACRCGGRHLGQDCCWKPECRVPGCGRFWCGLHCRQCGSSQKPFVGWRCRACFGFKEGEAGGSAGPESVPLPDGLDDAEEGDVSSEDVQEAEVDGITESRQRDDAGQGLPFRESIFGP